MRRLQINEVLPSKLNNVGLFHYLGENEKKQLLGICEVLEYKQGDRIITQGETSTCFFAVLSGMVNVTVQDDQGKEIFISCIGEGEFFGEAGLFNNAKRSADVSPVTEAQIIRIGRNDFFDFIRVNPSAGVKILLVFVNGLLKKLNDSNKEIASERKTALDQSEIDLFLQNFSNNK